MKLALLVYLASIIDSFSTALMIIGVLGGLTYFSTLAIMQFSNYGVKVYSIDTDEEIEKEKQVKNTFSKYWKLCAIIFPLLIFVSILLPKERTIYIMAGAYVTEQIATNDRVQKIGGDVLEVIEGKLSKMKESK